MRHAFSTEQEYTVEAILDMKITKTKKGNLEKSYLIKWDGCDEQSWEPTKNLTGCEEMLNAYMNRLSPITSPTSSDTEGDTSDGRRSITDAGAAYCSVCMSDVDAARMLNLNCPHKLCVECSAGCGAMAHGGVQVRCPLCRELTRLRLDDRRRVVGLMKAVDPAVVEDEAIAREIAHDE